jgi:hypothetical protein
MLLGSPTVRVLETLGTFTPLGIRFWDPALDDQVRDELRVRAWPDPGLRPVTAAFRTASDIYAFRGLPGLRALEMPETPPAGSVGMASPPSPPTPRRFVVEVEDARRRFLPAAFSVELPLPYRGLFLVGAGSGSPAEPVPRGFLLHSAPSRPCPPWLAAVRGELAERDGGAPAAHAVVRVLIPGEPAWHGLADAGGRFAVLLPWPTLTAGLGGSPAGSEGPLSARAWSVRVEVLYEPGRREALPGTAVPDSLSVLRQGAAGVWPEDPATGGVEETGWDGELAYGRELAVRTEGLARLLVSPRVSPP